MENTRKVLGRIMLLASLALAGGCGHHAPPAANPPPIHSATSGSGSTPQVGVASFYGKGFAGRQTASGETFDPTAMTCAHRTLPFGTWLKVTNLANGKTVEVRVNDRGPFARRRLIDLSEGAARRLEMIGTGTARVRIEVLPASSAR